MKPGALYAVNGDVYRLVSVNGPGAPQYPYRLRPITWSPETRSQLEETISRSFPWRSEKWRAKLLQRWFDNGLNVEAAWFDRKDVSEVQP